MDTHRCLALDLPGFGASRDAGRADLDPGLRADRRRDVRRARRRVRRRWSATRWAASSAPSWRCRSPRASSGSCSCRPPGSRPSTLRARRRRWRWPACSSAGLPARAALRVARSCAGRGCGGRRCSSWSATRRSCRSRSPRSSCSAPASRASCRRSRRCSSYSYRERLAAIEIPVLIVWGRNDLLVPVGDATRYQRLIGDNARVVVFEDTGHAPMIERPSRFNELLRGFLAGGARGRAGRRGASAGRHGQRLSRAGSSERASTASPHRGSARATSPTACRDPRSSAAHPARERRPGCAYARVTRPRTRSTRAARTSPARRCVGGGGDSYA